MKQFKATQEQKDAANTYVLAKAYTQTIRPELEKMQVDILEKFRYKWNIEKMGHKLSDEFINHYGEYCKRWFDTYMISDKDFAHCLSEYHSRFTERGFKVPEFGYCPLLIAEDLERQAREVLVNTMQPVTGITFSDFFNTIHWKENLNKYIDLTLQLLSPYLKNILVS